MSDFRKKVKAKKATEREQQSGHQLIGKMITESKAITFEIDPELELLIPPLNKEELILLEDSIRTEGLREQLKVWKEADDKIWLIDGHNRYKIITKLSEKGIEVKHKPEFIEFADKEAVKDWMILNQLGRRNLTDEQRSYLRGLRYEREKSKQGGTGANQYNSQRSQNVHTARTVDVLAEEYKVSPKTIQRDSEYARGIERIGERNPDYKRKILAGEEKLKKGLVQQLGRMPNKITSSIKTAADVNSYLQKINKPKTEAQQTASPVNDEYENLKKQIIIKLKTLSIESSKKEYDSVISEIKNLQKIK
ncbi:MAG: hypothetical protein CMO01_02655 [Thalassobius sp.]|nr:hypothetical protein [Thalassovita sp.]